MKPLEFSISNTKDIPSAIGVYIFEDEKGKALYIGKSVNVKARVFSHIRAADISSKEEKIVKKAKRIKVFLVPSEYSALILESRLIQKEKPKYNKNWQDDKSYLYIKITNEEFPKVYPVREKEVKDALFYIGPFSSLNVVTSLLRSIRKIFPFCSQKRIGKRACFYSKIGLCNPCPSQIEKLQDVKLYKELKNKYLQNINGVIELLKGNDSLLKEHFYEKLEKLKNEERFEEAIKMREQIKRLEALQRLSFEEKEVGELEDEWKKLEKFFKEKLGIKKLSRIECYDISNLSGKLATGSMVVMKEGVLDKGEYRRFKVKFKSAGDQERLVEVVKRRFKNDWERPDIILLDGGISQVKFVKRALEEEGIDIPVVGLAKNPDRLVIPLERGALYFRSFSKNKFLNFLRLLRDESHRFAKKYHLLLRKKKLLV